MNYATIVKNCTCDEIPNLECEKIELDNGVVYIKSQTFKCSKCGIPYKVVTNENNNNNPDT